MDIYSPSPEFIEYLNYGEQEDIYLEDIKHEFTNKVMANETSFKPGHIPWCSGKKCPSISEARKKYWQRWRAANPDYKTRWKKYIKKGVSKAERKRRSERAKERNKNMRGKDNGRARGVIVGPKYFSTVNECAQHFDITPHTVRNRIRSEQHDYRYADS